MEQFAKPMNRAAAILSAAGAAIASLLAPVASRASNICCNLMNLNIVTQRASQMPAKACCGGMPTPIASMLWVGAPLGQLPKPQTGYTVKYVIRDAAISGFDEEHTNHANPPNFVGEKDIKQDIYIFVK